MKQIAKQTNKQTRYKQKCQHSDKNGDVISRENDNHDEETLIMNIMLIIMAELITMVTTNMMVMNIINDNVSNMNNKIKSDKIYCDYPVL